MVVGRRDVEPLVDAAGWISDEVRKGLVEGLNRVVDILEDKERVN